MKKFYLLSILLSFIFNGYSQTGKPVLISLYQSKVPEGKIWKIEKDKPLLVEFNYFDKYSMCGAAVQSNPGAILIRSGIDQPFQVHEIYFKNLKKSAFANGNTYSITPTEDVCFYPGTYLIVGTCLRNVQILEYTLTKSDIEKRKLAEIRKEKQKEEEAKRIKEAEDAERRRFLSERAKTKYQLKVVNEQSFNNLNDQITTLTKDHFKKYFGEDSFETKYKLIFSSDTSGIQSINLMKISGKDLDSSITSQLKSLRIIKPQLSGYYISTVAEYEIQASQQFSKFRVRKYHDIFTYPFSTIPSYEINNKIRSKFYSHKDGIFKVKVYDRIIMGQQITDFTIYK